MLSKRNSHVFPTFKNLRFCVKNTLIGQIFLSYNFFYFFILNNFYEEHYFDKLKAYNKFFLKTFSIHWMRVSFKGKGYRLRKFKNTNKITFNFGHSHWAKLLINKNYFFKKFKRQNYLCLITNYWQTKIFKMHIKRIKRLNSYTKRGLRLKKQYIRRRFGKISQVTSSLH